MTVRMGQWLTHMDTPQSCSLYSHRTNRLVPCLVFIFHSVLMLLKSSTSSSGVNLTGVGVLLRSVEALAALRGHVPDRPQDNTCAHTVKLLSHTRLDKPGSELSDARVSFWAKFAAVMPQLANHQARGPWVPCALTTFSNQGFVRH